MLISWQTYCHWRGVGFKSHNLLGNSMSSPKPNKLNYLKCFNQWNYQHNYINTANVNKKCLFLPKCRIACWWTIGSDEHESHMRLWHITQVFGSIKLLAVSFFNNGMSSHFWLPGNLQKRIQKEDCLIINGGIFAVFYNCTAIITLVEPSLHPMKHHGMSFKSCNVPLNQSTV